MKRAEWEEGLFHVLYGPFEGSVVTHVRRAGYLAYRIHLDAALIAYFGEEFREGPVIDVDFLWGRPKKRTKQ